MGRRSLQASEQGIQAIKKALKGKKWSQTYLAGVAGCSRQTIWSLLQGNPTDCDYFMKVCNQLGLKWEEIAAPEPSKPKQQNEATGIDELVQKVRACIRADTAYMEQVGTMRMLRVNHPVPVADFYIDLNILQRVSSTFSFSNWYQEFRFDWNSFNRLGLERVEQPRVSATKIIQECRKLVVLGKPGSGKSTLLKSLAITCLYEDCNSLLGNELKEYVPIFITLKEFAEDIERESLTLRNAIKQKFERWDKVECAELILKHGRMLILLDGLDEIPLSQRKTLIREIRQLCKNDANNRFVFTCRTQSLQSYFDSFTEVEIADFTSRQASLFAWNWFASMVSKPEVEELTEKLMQELQENRTVAELAVTPILLNLICSVFRDEQGKLPKKRSDLYDKGIKDLLKNLARPELLSQEDIFKSLTLNDKENLLAKLAYILFKDNDYFPKQSKLERLIANILVIEISSSERVLKLLEAQHGLLVERSEGYFSFSHLTFQEYLTAKYILSNYEDRELLQSLVAHVTESHWKEVFLLAVEMAVNPDKLLKAMKSNIDALLAKDEELQQFLAWVSHKSFSINNRFKSFAIRAFYLVFLTTYSSIDCENIYAFVYDLAFGWSSKRFSGVEWFRGIQLFTDFANGSPNSLMPINSRHILVYLYGAACIVNPNIAFDLRKPFYETATYLSETDDEEMLENIWNYKKILWIDQLRNAIISHCEGTSFQFSKTQMHLLNLYYDANKLLVGCLNSDCYVSREVRQEIENTLFLPIAEIEKRKQQRHSQNELVEE